ncbi:hypothetical protein [Clostridium saccharoperbutylacetonicum]
MARPSKSVAVMSKNLIKGISKISFRPCMCHSRGCTKACGW